MIDIDPNADFDQAGPAIELEQPKQENRDREETTPQRDAEPSLPVAEPQNKALINPETDESGTLVAKNFNELWRLATVYSQSGIVPAGLNTPAKVFTALQYAHALGLKGIIALRNIMVVNGLPSIWGELPLALARNSPHFVDITEWVVNKDGIKICPDNKNLLDEVAGAVCETERRKPDGTVKKVTTWFTVADAKLAQLWGTKVWKVYPRRMLQMRARSQNLKDNFGDVLSGVAIAEYDFNTTGNEKGEAFVESETLPRTGAATLNAMAAQKTETVVLPPEGDK
jgi:hypothetical protein